MPRDNTPREMRLVAEWVALTFPDAFVRFRVSVGDLTTAMSSAGLSAAELRLLGHSRRWVDAMVVEPRVVHLVEAKIRLVPGALEQLGLYAVLFPKTPELEQFRDRELVLDAVYAVEDPAITLLASQRGIRVHIYHPPWVDEYLNEIQERARRPPQPRGLPTITKGSE